MSPAQSLGYDASYASPWSIRNPLSQIAFDEPIDGLVNDHMLLLPNGTTALKIFYASFLLGILNYASLEPKKKIETFYRWESVHDQLQLIAMYNESNDGVLHVHDIDFNGSGIFGQQFYCSIGKVVETKLNQHLPVKAVMVYRYESFPRNGDHGTGIVIHMAVGFPRSITCPENIAAEFSPMGISDFELARPLENRKLAKSLHMVSHKPARRSLEVASEEALIHSNILMKRSLFPLVGNHEFQIGVSGFFHGILLPALPNQCYRNIIKSKIGIDHLFVYIPFCPGTSARHLYIDFSNEKHVNIQILKHVNRQILHIWISAGGSIKKQILSNLSGDLKRRKRSDCDILHWQSENFDIGSLIRTFQAHSPKFFRHSSIVHNFNEKLKRAFLGRDVLLKSKNSYSQLARKYLFFGSGYLVGKIGDSTMKVDMLGGDKDFTKIMGIRSQCLPAITGVPSQLHQLQNELESGETEDAVYTRLGIAKDLVSCAVKAAQALDLLPAAASEVVGGVLGALGLVLTIVQQTRSAIKNVESIEDVIPLEFDEKVFAFSRKFVFMGIHPVMQSMIAEVYANEAAVLATMDQYPNIDRFLISASSKINDDQTLSYIDDNIIDLTKTYTFSKSRLMARDKILGGEFSTFCSLNEDFNDGKAELEADKLKFIGYADKFAHHYKNPTTDNLCKNAFGIMRKTKQRPKSDTLFLLYNGTDDVKGFEQSPNIFLLMNGEKRINGGKENDEFVIIGRHIFGSLNGSDGLDVVDFDGWIDGEKDLMIKGGEAFMDGMSQSLNMHSIEVVLGRAGRKDSIEVCNEENINLRGTIQGYDRISISRKCGRKDRRLNIILNNTVVLCNDPDVMVHYRVVEQSTSTSSVLDLSAGRHIIYFKATELKNVNFATRNSTHKVIYGNQNELSIKSDAEATLVFVDDDMIVRINASNFIMHPRTTRSLFDVIEKYSSFVQDNPHVRLIAKTEDHGIINLSHQLLSVQNDGGEKKLNLVSNAHLSKTVLFGNQAVDNYFMIADSLDQLDLIIYPHLSPSLECFIDLNDLAKGVHERSNGETGLRIHVESRVDDILLSIVPSSNTVRTSSTKSIGRILIKKGYMYPSRITINLYSQLELLSDHAGLSIRPYMMQTSQTILSIFPGSFDFYGTIAFSYAGGDLKPYRMNDTVVISNLASLGSESFQYPVTIYLIDYYQYSAKFDTLMLEFEDSEIMLRSFTDCVPDIQSMWFTIDEWVKNHPTSSLPEATVDLIQSEDDDDDYLDDVYETDDLYDEGF